MGYDSDYVSSQLNDIIQYFMDINQYFLDSNCGFSIGVYGSEYTCEELLKNGLVEYTFIAGSAGWSSASNGWKKLNFDLFQCFEVGETMAETYEKQYNSLLGIGVDTIIPSSGDFGAWSYGDIST